MSDFAPPAPNQKPIGTDRMPVDQNAGPMNEDRMFSLPDDSLALNGVVKGVSETRRLTSDTSSEEGRDSIADHAKIAKKILWNGTGDTVGGFEAGIDTDAVFDSLNGVTKLLNGLGRDQQEVIGNPGPKGWELVSGMRAPNLIGYWYILKKDVGGGPIANGRHDDSGTYLEYLWIQDSGNFGIAAVYEKLPSKLEQEYEGSDSESAPRDYVVSLGPNGEVHGQNTVTTCERTQTVDGTREQPYFKPVSQRGLNNVDADTIKEALDDAYADISHVHVSK